MATAAQDSASLAAEAYEAIHRCLLAGLPTQVGRKDEKGIYPRHARAQVPGVSRVRRWPRRRRTWVFAAQILDVGGKVWGMACARVEPLWIEQQAAHLLRTHCRDPHWSRKRGSVVAYEQVSLFGLILVERRPVTFQPQDPPLAHAIFLREALAPWRDRRTRRFRARQPARAAAGARDRGQAATRGADQVRG